VIIRSVALGLVVAACVAGCATPEPSRPPAATAFAAAMDRLAGPVDGTVEFVDVAAVASGAGPWTALRGSGSLARYAGDLRTTLRIDPAAATWSLTVGGPRPSVTVLAGGQDAQAIRRAATAAGWTGDDVLRRDLDLTQPLTLPAGTIAPAGADVVVGGPAADIAQVSGTGAGPASAAVRDCLGDVAVAIVDGAQGPVRAVGLRHDPADPAAVVSVMCAGGGSAAAVTDAVRSGSDIAGVPYARRFVDPEVEDLGAGTVRLTARNGPGVPAAYLLGAAARRDLPGIR
jgi:hypothetical protein